MRKGDGDMWMRTMKHLIGMGILIALFAGEPAFGSEAGSVQKGPAVHYGAYCTGPYGAFRKRMGVMESMDALRSYFGKKGLEVELREHTTRFITADIFKNSELLDTIIFDTETGKMRSIY